jgi:hypothetical protein
MVGQEHGEIKTATLLGCSSCQLAETKANGQQSTSVLGHAFADCSNT